MGIFSKFFNIFKVAIIKCCLAIKLDEFIAFLVGETSLFNLRKLVIIYSYTASWKRFACDKSYKFIFKCKRRGAKISIDEKEIRKLFQKIKARPIISCDCIQSLQKLDSNWLNAVSFKREATSNQNMKSFLMAELNKFDGRSREGK